MQQNKIKPWKSDGGFSIVELMAAMVISTIVFIVAYFVLSVFVLRFEQLAKISKLQDGAYNCIMAIKHGQLVEEDRSNSYQFLGLSNANRMSLDGNSGQFQLETGSYISGTSGISFKPPKNHSVYSEYDEVKISLNRLGYVNFDSNTFGINDYSSSNIRIFPKLGDSDMFVEQLIFARIDDYLDPQSAISTDIDIVRVYIKAGVNLGNNRLDLFNPYDDPYYVEYETFIAIEQGVE